MEKHRVAVTVFAEVEAPDQSDAEHITQRAVEQAILASAKDKRADGAVVDASWRRTDGSGVVDVRPVLVARVEPASTTFGNGYVRVRVTDKAFREPWGIYDIP